MPPRWLLLLILLFALAASGHELEVTTRLAAPAVIVKATYGGSEPVPFAKIQIYSPSGPGKEHQSANLDQRGYFAFVPAQSGSWKVVVDDELGHKSTLQVTVPEGFDASGEQAGNGGLTGTARLERALLGISLLVGITGFWYGYKSRRAN
jgi:nickel transport protein